MRKSIKIISSIFLSSMFMINGTLFAFATTDDINENLESKELCEASINEAFAADSIIVTMKNSCSLDFKNYDCEKTIHKKELTVIKRNIEISIIESLRAAMLNTRSDTNDDW